MAISFASDPLLTNITWSSPPPSRCGDQGGEGLRRGVPELGTVHVVDRAELVGDRREHPRVAMPERDRERARGGVDVVEAVFVEDPGALRRHRERQRPRRRRDQGRHRAPAAARAWRSRAARSRSAPAGDHAELRGHRQRVVVHRERRVAEGLAHLDGVPERLVAGRHVGDAGVTLALAGRVRQVHVADADHPDRDDLDQRRPGRPPSRSPPHGRRGAAAARPPARSPRPARSSWSWSRRGSPPPVDRGAGRGTRTPRRSAVQLPWSQRNGRRRPRREHPAAVIGRERRAVLALPAMADGMRWYLAGAGSRGSRG